MKPAPPASLRLAQVLTADRHFRQMGFHVLPDLRPPEACRARRRR
jgi:hypothetical protein